MGESGGVLTPHLEFNAEEAFSDLDLYSTGRELTVRSYRLQLMWGYSTRRREMPVMVRTDLRAPTVAGLERVWSDDFDLSSVLAQEVPGTPAAHDEPFAAIQSALDWPDTPF
uniref:Uncharacterized protein n=1 Tax=Melanopsichium pennsylvanicum 4 TaxID=1398559 RepID=A0A077R358_9BASI|nr:uncharacterized protein BN887_06105 [Melanopsichium pennsylvanicum 4]